MKSAIPSVWQFHWRDIDIDTNIAVSHRLLTVIVALLATALWAGIIFLVCWALGVSIAPGWLTAILAVIFAIAHEGLALARRAADGVRQYDADP